MTPEISVLISTYNNRDFVEKKLAEVERQSLFRRAEFLFLETGSPQREREALIPFCERHSQCKLITTDDRRTLYEAWNIGWDAAKAPFICYSNMDDCMHPRLLEYVVAGMKRHRWDACSVLIAKQTMDEHWNHWSSRRLKRLPLSLRPGPFTAWRTALKDEIGQFDGRFLGAGDKDFWSRLIARRRTFGCIKKVLYLYTKRENQLSKSDEGNNRREHDRALLGEKPYPSLWPYRMRRENFWLRYLFRFYPEWLTVAEEQPRVE